MEKKNAILISRRFLYVTVALLAWFGFSASIYAFLTEGWIWGILELLVSLGLVASAANKNIREKIEASPLPLALFIVLFFILLLQAYMEVIEILNADARILGELQFADIVRMVSSVGFLILLVVFVVEFFRLLRERT